MAELALEFLRQVDVIGVEEGDGIPTCRCDPEVARRAHAAVHAALVRQHADPLGIGRGRASRDDGALVGRAIVDEQQLPAAARSGHSTLAIASSKKPTGAL